MLVLFNGGAGQPAPMAEGPAAGLVRANLALPEPGVSDVVADAEPAEVEEASDPATRLEGGDAESVAEVQEETAGIISAIAAEASEDAEESEDGIVVAASEPDPAETGEPLSIEPVPSNAEPVEQEAAPSESGEPSISDPSALLREKPVIPDEPSPFMEEAPKETPKPEEPKKRAPVEPAAPARNAGSRAGGRPPAQPTPDPFAAAKPAPAPVQSKPVAAEAIEEPPAAPPDVPDPKKLADADELLKKAKMMWELEEYDASVKLAEKARKIRVSQLGEDHPKVADVNKMIEAAKSKLKK